MTPSELKYQYEQLVGGHFFDRKTLAFFGDKMSNFGVRDAGTHWELRRRSPVKHGLQSSHYFDKVTFQSVSQMTWDRMTATTNPTT